MKLLWLLVLMVSFISCQDIEEVREPDNLIPEQKMVEVLTDLSILNAAKNYNKRLLEAKGLHPDQYLYEKHNIDSLQLAESTHYYAKNFNRLENIYERVKQNLESVKQDYEEREENIEQKDSIEQFETEQLFDSLIIDPNRRRRVDSLVTSPTSVTY